MSPFFLDHCAWLLGRFRAGFDGLWTVESGAIRRFAAVLLHLLVFRLGRRNSLPGSGQLHLKSGAVVAREGYPQGGCLPVSIGTRGFVLV